MNAPSSRNPAVHGGAGPGDVHQETIGGSGPGDIRQETLASPQGGARVPAPGATLGAPPAQGHDNLLACRGLAAGYGASQVLFGLDFDIRSGEMLTLLGRNGMGKSTTIKALVGGLPARTGEIHFVGRPIHGMRADAIARLGMAIVPEGRQCFPNLSVREHLVAFADQRNGTREPWTLERLYRLFPRLQERQDHLGNQLSGGEQQMLAIARALSTNPRLLILDEATEGLAPVIREEIWHCLGLLREAGQTVLIVDKYVEKLVRLADRHLILERGRIAWSGTSAELDADRGLWTRFLGV